MKSGKTGTFRHICYLYIAAGMAINKMFGSYDFAQLIHRRQMPVPDNSYLLLVISHR